MLPVDAAFQKGAGGQTPGFSAAAQEL